jgi:hypothetical protein
MAFPGRIFIATDKEADSLIDSDRRRQTAEANMRQMESERNAALQREAELRGDLEAAQKIAGIAFFILILVIAIIALWFWLSLTESSPPPLLPPALSEPPPTTPPAAPAPSQIPTPRARPNVPSLRCTRGCGPPDDWEYPSWRFHNRPGYLDFECWRDRGIEGPCFH